MAFIRKRTTKNGIVSTSLVESYREGGRPKHRTIANLHGAETLAVALGRLAAERDKLRKERSQLEITEAEAFYEVFTAETLAGRVWNIEERKEIDRLLRLRKHRLRRAEQIDTRLARIQREGGAIKRYCSATDDEIRTEAAKHAKRLHDLECLDLGLKMQSASFRRSVLGQ
jgi:hypothetical protein